VIVELSGVSAWQVDAACFVRLDRWKTEQAKHRALVEQYGG